MKLSIIVHPRSRKSRIEKDSSGSLHVYVTQLPQDGKANKAVIKELAKYFNTKKGNVFILSGEKSKNKIVEII